MKWRATTACLFRAAVDHSTLPGLKESSSLTPGGMAVPGWRGFYFDPASWDGHDLFVPEGTGQIFVVERAKEVMERAELSNIQLQRITEIERQFP